MTTTRSLTQSQIDADYATSRKLSEALTTGLRALGWKKQQNVVTDGTRRVTRLLMAGGSLAVMLFEGGQRVDHAIYDSTDLERFLASVA